MKKFTLSIVTLILLFATQTLLAQRSTREVVYADDFESYNVGAKIAQSNPDRWATWSNTPGSAEDASVSNEQSSSPTKSLKVAGTNDNIMKLGNKTSGIYILSWDMYVPANFAGYYNFQHFEAPGVEWAFEVYFDVNGSGYMHAGGNNAATFSYPKGQWFQVENVIDLNDDLALVTINGAVVHQWQYSLQAQGQAGTKQLGSINFYAGATTGMTPTYYIDNIEYFAVPNVDVLYFSDFDSYTANAYVSVEIPEWFKTWSNTPGTAEDARFSTEQAETAPNSVKIAGTNDIVFKLGNKTSGQYVVYWDMFVPTANAGYYNFQHFEAPGVEWAFEVYFDVNGTGYMHAGGNNAATFNYPKNSWFTIENYINLDEDIAMVYINDVLVHTWQYSLQAQGQAGTKQLGGVNFYAGATTGMTPIYYFDNIGYIALVAGAQDPTIQISSSSIILTLPQGNIETRNLPIGNTGDAPLNVNIVPSFDKPNEPNEPNGIPEGTYPVFAGEFVESPNTLPGAPAPDDRNVTLNYDGENATGIGFTNGAQWRAAVRFPASMVAQYNGMYLSQVMIYINELANDHKLLVYDMGSINLPGPGALIHEQPINPLPGWNTINLTTPVYISGRDLWVGYWMDQPAGVFPAGADAGPQHPDGAWVASGPGWSLLTLPRNWNIRAKLTGTASPVWLSATPNQMSIAPGENTTVTVGINAQNLQQLTIYRAKLHVRSNDPANQQVNINVWITVLVGLNEAGEQAYVSMYPNPATTMLNLNANTQIKRVIVTNNLGQIVYSNEPGLENLQIDVSSFRAGIYLVKVETANGTAIQKVVIQ